MLLPKKKKYNKEHKGRVGTRTKSGATLAFGSVGLKALDGVRVTSRQIEAARKAAVRHIKRQGRFFIRIFPHLPVSKKPNEVRMGKGKGDTEYHAARVATGRILFEIEGVQHDVACEALLLAGAKLPIKTKIIRRYD